MSPSGTTGRYVIKKELEIKTEFEDINEFEVKNEVAHTGKWEIGQ